MKRRKQGFSLYLTFLVTTVIFILVSGSYEISRISLDIGKSSAVDAVLFHAADGGLERGLAKLRKKFAPFTFSYRSNLLKNQIVEVRIDAVKEDGQMNLSATATLYAGKSIISTRRLSRHGIADKPGRQGIGHFMEAS